MSSLAYIVILLHLFDVSHGQTRVDPLVDSKIGLIRGLNADDGDYSMFLGIPYATVDPMNPFGPSIPHPGFHDTFDAFDDSGVCPQKEAINNTVVGTSDCLRLNVYVPKIGNSRNRLPVMVYIHGGGYVNGYGGRFLHGPTFLVKHDVIIVTINYRLGAYGFLCLDTPKVPGNQGLKDQLTALRWVKNNIDAFGGDSNKITIFGESAGAASVDFQLIYTQEKLFNNIIIQSGTSLAPFTNPRSDPNAALKLAAHLGFESDDTEDALEFLRTVDTDLIVSATHEANILVRPCVEKTFDNVERFITDHPTKVNIPNARTIPILIGFTNNERGDVFENVKPEEFQNVNPFSDLKEIYSFNDKYLKNMVENVRQFYIGDEPMGHDVKVQLGNLISDLAFLHPTYRSIEKYIDNGASSVYHYVFSYNGERNFVKKKDNVTVDGALHSDELAYLFNIGILNETPTPEDQLTIDRITTLWTNFAKYSNPTPEVTDLLPISWPSITGKVMNYLDINSELVVRKRPFHDRMAFWKIFFDLNKRFVIS